MSGVSVDAGTVYVLLLCCLSDSNINAVTTAEDEVGSLIRRFFRCFLCACHVCPREWHPCFYECHFRIDGEYTAFECFVPSPDRRYSPSPNQTDYVCLGQVSCKHSYEVSSVSHIPPHVANIAWISSIMAALETVDA